MKFNWGTGIFIFYTLFVATLIFIVVKSTSVDRSLVVDEYYAEDLNYQQTYEKLQNSLNLSSPVVIKNEANTLFIQFPELSATPSGTIHLYRASNKSLDQVLPIQVSADRSMHIPLTDMMPGMWQVTVDWQANGVGYLEKTDFIVKS